MLLSVRAMAQRLSTDPATIVRIVRGLGFASYREFRHHLHALLIAYASRSIDDEHAGRPQASRGDQESLARSAKNLHVLKNSLDANRLAKLAKRLFEARRVEHSRPTARPFSPNISRITFHRRSADCRGDDSWRNDALGARGEKARRCDRYQLPAWVAADSRRRATGPGARSLLHRDFGYIPVVTARAYSVPTGLVGSGAPGVFEFDTSSTLIGATYPMKVMKRPSFDRLSASSDFELKLVTR